MRSGGARRPRHRFGAGRRPRRRRSRATAAAAPPPAESTLRRPRAESARLSATHFTSAGTTIVKRAPPSAQFSAADPSAFDGQHAAGDRQPHPGPRSACLRVRTAIEPLEDVRQVGRRDARTVIADGDRQAFRLPPSPCTSIGEPAGAYCAAFSSRCDSAAAVSRGSSRTSRSESIAHVDRMAAQHVLDPARAPPRRSRTAPPTRRPRSRRRHRCAPSPGCSGTGASAVRPPTGSGRSAHGAPARPATTPGGCWRRRESR